MHKAWHQPIVDAADKLQMGFIHTIRGWYINSDELAHDTNGAALDSITLRTLVPLMYSIFQNLVGVYWFIFRMSIGLFFEQYTICPR